MKFLLFVLILITVANPHAGASFSNGFYNIEYGSQSHAEVEAPAESSSEVTVSTASAPSPVMDSSLRPKENPKAPVAAAAAAAPTPTPAPATPANDYTVTSTGTKGEFGEKLVNLRSCKSLRFISEAKSSRNSNDCDTLITANSFVETLMRQLPLCTKEAVRASGETKPIKQIKIFNGGSDRPGAGRSLHYAARAIDIYQIDVVYEDNSTFNMPMVYNSRKKPFYDAFNKCWERETKATMKKQYPKNTKCHKYEGVVDCYYNKAHHNHVHVSLPYCPKKTGYNTW